MTLKEELMRVGWDGDQAEALVRMTAGERAAVLPVIGNAFSDMPLFRAIREVLVDPNTSVDLKRMALTKSYAVTGPIKAPGFTDEQVIQEAAKYADLSPT